MQKAIYLAKRKPSFTRDQFVLRWRKHGALAMSTSLWANTVGYVQAEAVQSMPFPGASDDYDGVAYIFQKEHVRTQQQIADSKMMETDEYETFAGLVLPVILIVEEKVLKKGVPGGVTAFLYFIDPARAAPIAEHYSASAADRVILNVRRDELTKGDLSSQIPYKAVVEVSGYTLDTLKSVLESGDAAPWRTADLPVITRECVMWDRVS